MRSATKVLSPFSHEAPRDRYAQESQRTGHEGHQSGHDPPPHYLFVRHFRALWLAVVTPNSARILVAAVRDTSLDAAIREPSSPSVSLGN